MDRLADPCQVTTDPFDEKSFDEKVSRHATLVGLGGQMRRHGKVTVGLGDTPFFGVSSKSPTTLSCRRIWTANRTDRR
jgi:hypothetical protein